MSQSPPEPSIFKDFKFQTALAPLPIFEDFDFRIAPASQQDANFAALNFQNAPTLPVFDDFGFQIALAPQHGANFGDIFGNPPQLPFLGADFPSLRRHKTMGKHSILRNSYPPKPPHLTHLSCITSARSHLLVDRSSAATLSTVGS